jgi:MIP family channel proteins
MPAAAVGMSSEGENIVSSPDTIKRLVCEFLGTFALCFFGIGAIIMTQGANLLVIALAHGLAIGLMITAVGHISGGHFNPALTIGLFLGRKISLPESIAYIVSQIVGAVAACLVLMTIFPKGLRDAVGFGIPAVGPGITVGDVQIGFDNTNALIAEIVMTFFLMFVVYGAAVDTRSVKAIAGLAIGLTITIDILMGGAVSGAAMNPARYLGPAIVDGNFDDAWIWIVGPIVGAIIAAVIYIFVLYPEINEQVDVDPAPAEELNR